MSVILNASGGGSGGRTVLTANRTFYVSDFFGTITGGTLYTDGWYLAVSMTGGHGSSATANIRVLGGTVIRVALVSEGLGGYHVGDLLSANSADIGGTGSGFTVAVALAGSDINGDGSLGKPWATLQKASDTLSLGFEILAPAVVTVQVGAGAYNGFAHTPIIGTGLGNAILVWQGQGSTEADARLVKITENANLPSTCVAGTGSYVVGLNLVNFKQFNFVGPLSQDQGYFGCSGATLGNFDGSFNVFSESNFGDAIYNINNVSQLVVHDNIVFDGGQYDIYFNVTSSQMQLAANVTFKNGTGAGSGASVTAGVLDMVTYGTPTFTGTYTGSNVAVHDNGIVIAGGAGLNFFPGTPGSTTIDPGSFYDDITSELVFAGATSGLVTVTPLAVAGTWTFKWPNSGGTNGYFLQTDGTGATTWAPATASPGGANTDVQFNNSSAFGGDSGFTYAGSGQATLALGTITANAKALNITGTWNNSGVTFDAPLFMNITNTASGSASMLADLQIGGSSIVAIGHGGRSAGIWLAGLQSILQYGVLSSDGSNTFLDCNSNSSTVLAYAQNNTLSVSTRGTVSNGPICPFTDTFGTPDVGISRSAAGVLAVGNASQGDASAKVKATTGWLLGVIIANLPSGPSEGMIAHITDGDAGLAWGATAVNSGAGATKYLVWYNGTNWTVFGK